MSQFGAIGEETGMLHLRYQYTFGEMPHGTVYMDYLSPMKTGLKEATVNRLPELKQLWFDRQPKEIKEALLKAAETKAALTTTSPLFATGTTYSGTSGSIPVLLPSVVDPTLYDRTRVDLPLSSGLLPRVSNVGIFADIIRRTALPTAVFKAEGAALDTATSTYSRAVSTIKFIYGVGELTGPLLAASSQQWQSALALEQEGQFRAVKELEEDCIINGNPTTGDTGGTTTDNTAFTGMIQSFTTNNTNKSGAKISLDDIRVAYQVMREARGEPDLIVTDWKTLNDIKGLVQELLRYPAPGATLNFGVENVMFEGVPIVPDIKMPTTAAARELLVLTVKRGNNIQVRVLQEPTFEELAKNADSYKFMVKEYVTLLIAHENWCYRYRGLA